MQKFAPGCRPGPSWKEAALFWWKLGWISFGGTAAHLAILHRELVEKRRWIEPEDFFHALSHCMLLPGPEGQQLATYIGWKLHGKLGGLVAGTLFVLPSTAILLGLSVLYVQYGAVGWVILLFRVLKPMVVALVLRALFQIGRRALESRLQWLTAVASFVCMTFLNIPLPWIMGAIVVAGLVAGLVQERGAASTAASEVRMGQRVRSVCRQVLPIVGGCVAAGGIPLSLLWLWAHDFPFWMKLSGFFTRTAFVTIGGSYTVIPYVAQLAVTKFHWLSHAEMLDGFALAETTPGPLIIVVGYVGFMAGFHHFDGSIRMGSIALLVTVFYTFLPCFLFIFVGGPWILRSAENRWIRPALKLVTAAVVAAILKLTLFLVHGLVVPAATGRFDMRAAAGIVAAIVVLQASSRFLGARHPRPVAGGSAARRALQSRR